MAEVAELEDYPAGKGEVEYKDPQFAGYVLRNFIKIKELLTTPKFKAFGLVANLPTPPVIGMYGYVTDADTPVIGSTVVGGAAAKAVVWWNGANWTVMGV